MNHLYKTISVSIVIILIVSFGAYANTLFNGFVYDDDFQIIGNKWIKDVRYVPEIFSSSAWGFKLDSSSNYYRPFMHLIFMVDYHMFGLKPWGYHLTNIIFHAGVSVLVFLIASLLFNQSQIRTTNPQLQTSNFKLQTSNS